MTPYNCNCKCINFNTVNGVTIAKGYISKCYKCVRYSHQTPITMTVDVVDRRDVLSTVASLGYIFERVRWV